MDWAAIPRNRNDHLCDGRGAHAADRHRTDLRHGLAVETPAAFIREGTTPNQVVVTATLEDIVEKARDIRPPSVLVVGEVVRLHEELDWFTPQALPIENFQEVLLSL